ncbi:MAG: Glutamate-tRNA ligase 1, partial [Candidatus Giovannonibacteria bacterium GW2011_GWA2_53_7]
DGYYDQLIEKKLAYPCFCTEEQLTLQRTLQQKMGKPPRYSGTCRELTAKQIQEKRNAGLKPALRFHIPDNEVIAFHDLVRGEQKFSTNDLGDFIIRRTDGTSPFMYCNAIDDALMGVTHVLRGEDHLTNTPRQIAILTALDLPVPTYAHIALIVGSDGSPLSKRHGSRSLHAFDKKVKLWTMHEMQRDDLKQLNMPDSPGVYFFRGPNPTPHKATAGQGREILYIGKAASLRDRMKSYFAADLVKGRGARIVGMVEQAATLEWTVTDSVLEALILEANLIKQHQPQYNIDEKDNKSFNYLVVTKEDFPRVLIVRGRELFDPLKASTCKLKAIFGPFPSGLKEALKIIRRIFPYRDNCILWNPRGFTSWVKPCFNRQIGLCPGVCSGEVGKREYAETIRHIMLLFSGNFQGLKRALIKEMKEAAKKEEFEKAAVLRRQVTALEHIRDVSLIKDEYRFMDGGPSTSLRVNTRIEAYDVAHTSGEETVGVMTVVAGGEPVKSAYRKFKIQSAKNNDVAALRRSGLRPREGGNGSCARRSREERKAPAGEIDRG